MKITKTQLRQIIKEELEATLSDSDMYLAEVFETSSDDPYKPGARDVGEQRKEVSRGISKEWWLATGDDRIKVIRDIYKRAGQVPPAGPQARADAWENLIKQREAKLAAARSVDLE